MGSAESNHSDLFDIVAEEKVEEIQETFRAKRDEYVTEIIEKYRQIYKPSSLVSTLGEAGPSGEDLKVPGALRAEFEKMYSDQEYVNKRANHHDDMTLRVLCQLNRFDPDKMSDDELREKLNLMVKGMVRVIGCKVRKTLQSYKAEFIEKMKGLPTSLPVSVLREHLQQGYALIDTVYSSMIQTPQDYVGAMFMHGMPAQ